MQNEILDLIDQIEMEQAIAEMAVCDALMNSYAKTCAILENASDNADLSSYDIFQEGYEVYQEGEKWDRVKQAGSTAWKEAKGKKSENIVIRILKFIPRLIMAFVRSLRTNKKAIDKKIDEVEKVAEKITEAVEKGDISEEDISNVTNNTDNGNLENDRVDKNGNIKHPIHQDPTPKTKVNKSVEVTERGFVQGEVTEDTNDAARRAAARNTRKLNNAAKNQPLSLPYDEYNASFRYANGDFLIKCPWETFNMLEKMNTKTLDYAELMLPIESALEMIVDAFSETRLNSKGKPVYNQKRNTSDLIYDVRTRDLPGKIVLIKNKIKEADQFVSKLDEHVNIDKKWKIRKKRDVRECKLSEILIAFRYASQWLGQTENILEVSAKRIKSVVDHLPTFKSGSAHDPYDHSEFQAATYLKPDDANTITECVNRVQSIVDQANKLFARIVRVCGDALLWIWAGAHRAAEEAGVYFKNTYSSLGDLRNWARVVPVPDRQGEMFDNVDIHGYRNGVRDFNDLIRKPRNDD